MQKVLSILAATSLLTLSASAKLWRVNNITGVNANFTTLQAAVPAASAGDTIYLEPSPTPYIGVEISKKITIIGNGYFNTSGLNTVNTGLQANTQNSTIGEVYFYPGSEGSTIMGCMLTHLHVFTSDITVKRNYISGNFQINNLNPSNSTYRSWSGLDIRQNVINSLTSYNFSSGGGIGISNVSIQNNIFYTGGNSIAFHAGVSGYIQNNVFIMNYFYGISMNVYDFQINNNIQVGGSFTTNNCVYFNNIGTATQFGSANNNKENISTTALFTDYNNGTETRYNLAAAGPGIGAGFNGVDVGVFGGPDPYKLSGIPPVPSIYLLTAPATTTTTTLPVTISTRSNN